MPKRTVAISIIAVFVLILFGVSVGAQQECPSPRLIDTITGNGTQQTAPFTTSTSLLRLSYNAQATRETVPVIMQVRDADDPDKRIVGDASTEGPGSGESFINAPPGRYFLDIGTTDAQYTIKIEGCGPSAQASPGEGTNVQGTVQPKSSSPPKSTTAPVQPPPQPPAQPKATPQPISQPPPSPGPLMNAGGPKKGPVPRMPDGGCPREFPDVRSNGCFR